jgi:CRP-like cAMP-binding protein
VAGVLDGTDLFASLPPDVRARLGERARTVLLGRGDLLFRKGDDARHLYLVTEGRVAVAAHASDGRESVVAVLGPGSLLGEMPLFDDGPRSADARALTRAEVVALDFDDLRDALAHHPEALWEVVRLFARRLRATDEALTDAMFLDVPGRTAKRLLELAGDEDEFEMPLTQEELAGVVGASRERVNRALATFVKLRWLEISGRTRYRVLERDQLAARGTA